MINLPEPLLHAISILQNSGFQTFLVGGCVRDMLLHRQPRDYDLLTCASIPEIKAAFGKTVDIGAEHGSLIVFLDEFRIDINTLQSATSEIVMGHSVLDQDLARRDFSINAMAMDLTGRVYDPWQGQQDLQDKIIRATCNHPRELFEVDPLRMMRAIRLAVVYGFAIEPDTYEAIRECSSGLDRSAPERIREELNRILLSSRPAHGMRMLQECGLLSYVMPELEPMVGMDQRNFRHNLDLFEHSLSVLEGVPPRLNVRLAALLHDVGKPCCFTIDEEGTGHFYNHHVEGISISQRVLKRLKYDHHTVNDVSTLIGAHMSRYAKLRTSSLKKLIMQVGQDNLQDLFDLQKSDIIGSAPPCDFSQLDKMKEDIREILREGLPLEMKDLAVNGTDLIDLGYRPGPLLGSVLNELMEMVLEDPACNQREVLLALARKRLIT